MRRFKSFQQAQRFLSVHATVRHYAAGLLGDGSEADIYNSGDYLLNVATGAAIAGVIGWRRMLSFRPARNHGAVET